MRVLLLGDLESPHTSHLVEGLVDLGHDVLPVGFGRAPSGSSLSLGESNVVAATRYGLAVPRIAAAVRKFRPDLVHALFVSSYGAAAVAATRGSPPVSMTALGSDVSMDRSRVVRAVRAHALCRAAFVTYDSEDVQDVLRREVPTVERVRFLFGPELAWTQEPRRDERVVFSPRQGRRLYNIDQLRDAFGVVADRLKGWTLDVISWNAEMELEPAPWLRSCGRLDRVGMKSAFLRASVFVSVPTADAAAASVLEGMAAGSFPVVSDLPANREWIDHDVNGLIVPVHDSGALTEALMRACTDPALRAKAADHNRKLIAETASWETQLDRLNEQMRKATGVA